MDTSPSKGIAQLTWLNVGAAFSFIIFDALVSRALSLGIGTSIVTAAIRCIVQLSLIGLLLKIVFETNNPWGVAGIACKCFSSYSGNFLTNDYSRL